MNKINLKDAIIGTGYIGSYLKKKTNIKKIYNSKNIQTIRNSHFNNLYIAAPSSKKFLSNKNPKKDKKNIEILINYLKTIECKKVICISTVDVYSQKTSSEKSLIFKKKLNPYGLNRLNFNRFIKKKFKNHLIVKLPSLFGYKEKKGFFYDLINSKEVEHYNKKSELQWYYTPNLFDDIKKLKKKNIRDINLISEPISCENIAKSLNIYKKFGKNNPIIKYKIYSIHNFKKKKYLYSKEDIIKLMKSYFKFIS